MTSPRLPGPGPHDEPAELADRRLNPWIEGRLADLVAPGETVLDLGCGRGYWMRVLGARGLSPIGLEPDRARAAIAAAQGPVVVGDGARLPLASASVDAVWSLHVLHHLPDPPAALGEMARVLRPGGHLVLAETVDDNPLLRAGRSLHDRWDGVGIHSRFRAARVPEMLEESGFEVVDRRQHSLVSFAAWALPRGGRQAWSLLSGLEARLPRFLDRFGAHVEIVGRRR